MVRWNSLDRGIFINSLLSEFLQSKQAKNQDFRKIFANDWEMADVTNRHTNFVQTEIFGRRHNALRREGGCPQTRGSILQATSRACS